MQLGDISKGFSLDPTKGLCPLDPYKPLKRLDLNIYETGFGFF